jgi:hypothetical protein
LHLYQEEKIYKGGREMLQGIIIRGTTPEHEFDLPYPLELVSDVRVTYGQGGKSIFTKAKEDCTLSEGKISVLLT